MKKTWLPIKSGKGVGLEGRCECGAKLEFIGTEWICPKHREKEMGEMKVKEGKMSKRDELIEKIAQRLRQYFITREGLNDEAMLGDVMEIIVFCLEEV